jgi:signal transduction histidine kinase
MSPTRQGTRDQAARLRVLHGAALAMGAHVAAEPRAVARLLTEIVDQAAAALGGRDGLLVLAHCPAWDDLPPGTSPADGHLILSTGGRMRRQPVRRDGLSAFVLETGQSASVPDTTAGPPFGPYPDLVARGIRSLANVPLVAGGETLGALSLGFDRPGPLTAEDRDLLDLFAAHAAAALERLKLVDAERRRGDALARQAEELGRREAESVALRQLDHLKNEFIASISHELRAPLTLILGYAELLHSIGGALPAETRVGMASEVLDASKRLKEIVDNLLDFAQLQRGEIRLQPAVYDLVPDLEGAVARHGKATGGERLRLDAPPELTVRADRDRLLVAIGHLITNALHYAPTGPIVVRAGAAGRMVRVEVEDQGPGIPPDEQPRVWEKFYRGAAVAGLNVQPGGGVGLAIAKALVEAHGGRVGLESAVGQGTRVWLELPAERSA